MYIYYWLCSHSKCSFSICRHQRIPVDRGRFGQSTMQYQRRRMEWGAHIIGCMVPIGKSRKSDIFDRCSQLVGRPSSSGHSRVEWPLTDGLYHETTSIAHRFGKRRGSWRLPVSSRLSCESYSTFPYTSQRIRYVYIYISFWSYPSFTFPNISTKFVFNHWRLGCCTHSDDTCQIWLSCQSFVSHRLDLFIELFHSWQFQEFVANQVLTMETKY